MFAMAWRCQNIDRNDNQVKRIIKSMIVNLRLAAFSTETINHNNLSLRLPEM